MSAARGPGGRASWGHDHWTWRYLSVLVLTDEDEAHRIVGAMTDKQRHQLLETALVAQGLVQRDVPEARDWHRRSAAAWGQALVLTLLHDARRSTEDDGQPW